MNEQILFLDDCARRSKEFRSRCPGATLVTTAAECIASLKSQDWEEVHLDHDLNGKTYEDSSSPECGMEVVRWVTLAKPCVRTFVVHTHNEAAGPIMVAALEEVGYRVVRAPFQMRRFDWLADVED